MRHTRRKERDGLDLARPAPRRRHKTLQQLCALLLGLAVCAVVGALLLRGLADVLDMPIRVVRSEQTCALGAAMFAAVAAGVYKDINEATRHMGSDIEAEYRPDEKRALIYEKLYKKYLELAKLAETIN